jgi:hypothetical protein
VQPGWRSGLFGRARFAGPSRQALAVPASAVVRRGALSVVFIVTADGHAELRVVSIGDRNGDRVTILAGATAGERVIVNPPPALTDGAAVAASRGEGR